MLSSISAYVRSLWRGEVPLGRLVVTDMLMAGTVANIACSALALLAFAAGLPAALSMTLHFAALPYNALLLNAVWRAAPRSTSAWAWMAQPVALVWFVTMLVV